MGTIRSSVKISKDVQKCAQVRHGDYEYDNEVKCENCEGDHPV